MKALVAILFLSLVSLAADPAQQTSIQTRTTAGKSWIVAVGSCSFPLPNYYGGSVSSNFSYSACQEYITANYEVSGSGWGKDYKLIPGTERTSHKIELKQNGHSVYVSEDQVDFFDYIGVQTACQSIRQATAGMIVHVTQTPCAQGH